MFFTFAVEAEWGSDHSLYPIAAVARHGVDAVGAYVWESGFSFLHAGELYRTPSCPVRERDVNVAVLLTCCFHFHISAGDVCKKW